MGANKGRLTLGFMVVLIGTGFVVAGLWPDALQGGSKDFSNVLGGFLILIGICCAADATG